MKIKVVKDPYNPTDQEISRIVENFLRNYSSLSWQNKYDERASKVFLGAISYATDVFKNRLVLGGMHETSPHCEEILNKLQELIDILNK